MNIGFGEEIGIIEIKIRTLSGALVTVNWNHLERAIQMNGHIIGFYGEK